MIELKEMSAKKRKYFGRMTVECMSCGKVPLSENEIMQIVII